MSNRKIRAGRAEIEAILRDRITPALRKLKAKLTGFAAGSARIGRNLMIGGALGMAPLLAATSMYAKAGDDLNKMSLRTGESVENLSTLGFVATESGASITDLETGIRGMLKTTRAAERGLSTANDALAAIGVSTADLNGLSPEEQFEKIADALGRVDEGKRAAVAMDIFGRAGMKLLPMLNLGSQGIDELQQRARDLNLEFSTEDANTAAELTDRWFELTEVFKMTAYQVGAALAPSLIQLFTWLTSAASGAVTFIRENRQLVVYVAAAAVGVMGLGGAFVSVAALAALAAMAVQGLIALIGILQMPFVATTALVVAGAAAWLYYTEQGNAALSWFTERLSAFMDWGKSVFQGVYDAIAAKDWALAGSIMWTALRVAWLTGIGWIMRPWIDFKFGFMRIFDQIISGLRFAWNDLTTFIAKGIIWLIEKANAASEALTGSKLIDIDTDQMKKNVDQDSKSFQDQLREGLLERERDRLKSISDAKSQYDVGDLQNELADMISQAAEARAEFESQAADSSGPASGREPPSLKGLSGSASGSTSSAFTSFNAAVLSRFRGSSEKEQKLIADATQRSAEELETLNRNLLSGVVGGLRVT